MTTTEQLVTIMALVVAASLVVAATVAAVRSLWRGDGFRKTLKTGFVTLIDAIIGLG
jgi:hypothetical protein